MPATCDSTETVLYARPVPIAFSSTGILLSSTLLTTTGTAELSCALVRAPLPADCCEEAPFVSVQPLKASRARSAVGATSLVNLIMYSVREKRVVPCKLRGRDEWIAPVL